MIKYKHGDILRENTQALINTVNCVGVMGRGIALQFKKAYPDNFNAYEQACKKNEVKPGHMFIFETGLSINPRYIINFPTKRHWRAKSLLEDIDAGLNDLVRVIQKYNIHSVAIPPLGSGLGGLDWNIVKSRIEKTLQSLTDVHIIVFEPKGAPNKIASRSERPKMTPGRAALIGLMDRYLNGLLDPFITLLEVHKLLYFMQETGEPLRLKYQKAIYGPYAENLRHVLSEIEGHFVSGYADGGDKPGKRLMLIPNAIEEAKKFLANHPNTRDHLERVSKLVEGFESPFGLELLSTIHWVMTKETVVTLEDVIRCIYSWNKRKKQFTRRQIEIAIETLSSNGWVVNFPFKRTD